MRGAAGLVLAGALSASALLLPPGMTIDDKESSAIALAAPFAGVKSYLFQLPCPSCAFGVTQYTAEGAHDGENSFSTQGGAYDLLLNFSISEDGQQLRLGRTPVHPLSSRSATLPSDTFAVAQIPAGVDYESLNRLNPQQILPLKVTSFGIQTDSEKLADFIEPVHFTIVSLNDEYLGFDRVQITLGRNSDQELMIVNICTLRPDHHKTVAHGSSHLDDKGCGMVPEPLCKLQKMLAAQLRRLGGGSGRVFGHPCAKGFGGHRLGGHHRGGPNAFVNEDGRPVRHHGRPHHAKPHHHGGHHHRHHTHSFLGAVSRGFLAVIVPIMAGVAVGMAVSLFGLLFSRIVCFAWNALRGIPESDYDSVPQEDVFLVYDDKVALADAEALPVYEHAPPYAPVEKGEQ